MYHVLAKETTVTIGERVFSPLLATTFAEDLPAEVAERADLLHIEEVPDEQPPAALGALSATGTLVVAPDEGEPGSQGQAQDPALLMDEALAGGVTVLNVGEDDEGLGEELDPFADPADGPVVLAEDDAPAPQTTQARSGRGRGGRK